jgi:NAD(P)-dependent dehydrogenase (short-subunit alcohol dehydrogenase family)
MSRSYAVAGRTVFITGAARGIGAGAARRFHSQGANVALVGLEPDLLAKLADELGERAAWFEADVTDLDALEGAVAGTVERFGRIDVAIANAGIHYIGALATAPVEAIERVIEVNLMGVWRTNRAVLPQVMENRGYLLNVASLAAASHAPLMGPYAASKSGVEALTNSLRIELAPSGARVGCAYFSFIDTDLVRVSFEHPSTKAIEKMIPAPLRKPAPLSAAVDALDRAVAGRRSRVWAPRHVGGALRARGIMQPLMEKRAMNARGLREALRLADASDEQDPMLGVAVRRERSLR